ncbi:MAG: hypothetical protein L6V93_11145 [Clostridiales bacterium]|nr:MAG: hypothetical protein L6V93_11145 [Clostridiales bacterium]
MPKKWENLRISHRLCICFSRASSIAYLAEKKAENGEFDDYHTILPCLSSHLSGGEGIQRTNERI